MADSQGRAHPLRVRAARHIAATSALVLAVCAAIGAVSLSSYRDTDASLAGLTEVVQGTVTPLGGALVRADWTDPAGARLSAEIALAVSPPETEVPAAIAYDPSDPRRAVVPGAQVFADADRAFGGMVFTGLIAALVLLTALWLAVTRSLPLRRPTASLAVRRVRFQRGLLTRSYLETESTPRRWIPVHFDPALHTLPSPTTVQVHGDPRRSRLVAVTLPGTVLYPSGPVRMSEPPGRRTDNAAEPDAPESTPGLARQVRVDAPATLTAPLVGLFWSFIDNSGFTGWLAATGVTASLALWLWSIRGSDPS
ncbi:hypothetical protein ACFPM7_17600 [Actinokineospora guangxiensis]|uniref:DUF3592 domain-containing protein n=1 Tax=Actinokineospora guangxiensis TaxID=1490288 RepID=A0ABW0ERS3_9PSEU